MNDFPWLTTLMVVPLVGSLIVAALPKAKPATAKAVTLGFSLVTLVLVVVMALQFDGDSADPFQFVESHQWIPSFGISYSVGIDGIALVLIALSAVLVPVVVLAGWNDVDGSRGSVKGYFALILVLESLMIGVFASLDVFLFYVFFEVMLIPVYFLIGRYGGVQRSYAAVKFLLYSLVGGLFMLAAMIGLYVVSANATGTGTFDYLSLVGLDIDGNTQKILFLGFFLAFAVKAPLWPFHTWLPDAAAEAKAGTSVLLIGVLDKVGTFGMLRFCLQMFPNASQWATPVVIALALLSILYGGLAAIGQQHMMRLVAFTSVSHFGFIVLGIFAFTRMGGQGSVLYMLNHGFGTAALFLLAGMLIARHGSPFIRDYGGWQRVTPLLAGTFLVAGLSALALPGLGSFVSEFLVMMGTFQRYPWVAAISSIGIILAALYVLLWYQRVFTGPPPGRRVVDHDGAVEAEDDPSVPALRVPDLVSRERLVVAPLIAIFVVLGFYPNLALQVINPAVDKTLSIVGVQDPAPSAGAAEGSAK